MRALRSLDLFSCIGCHALGFQRAGIETVGLCEINPWRRARLAELFPKVPIHADVRQFCLSHADLHAEIVIGGPPCGATSVAAAVHGKRSGNTLWPDMLIIGRNMAVDWFVVEQPPGNAAWEDQVADDLRGTGRHVARFEFGANDVGAPYLRRRVFIVACASLPRLALARAALPSAIDSVKRAANARGDWNPGEFASLPLDARSADEFDRGPKSAERRQWIEALGDSNPPHMAEVIGRAIVAVEQQEREAV